MIILCVNIILLYNVYVCSDIAKDHDFLKNTKKINNYIHVMLKNDAIV